MKRQLANGCGWECCPANAELSGTGAREQIRLKPAGRRLRRASTVLVTTLFDYLCRRYPGQFQEGQRLVNLRKTALST